MNPPNHPCMRILLFLCLAALLGSCARTVSPPPAGGWSGGWFNSWQAAIVNNVWYNRSIEPVRNRGLTRFRVTIDLTTKASVNYVELHELLPPGATVVRQSKGSTNCTVNSYNDRLVFDWSRLSRGKHRVTYEIEVDSDKAAEKEITGYIAPSGTMMSQGDLTDKAWKRLQRRGNRVVVRLDATSLNPIKGIRMVATNKPQ